MSSCISVIIFCLLSSAVILLLLLLQSVAAVKKAESSRGGASAPASGDVATKVKAIMNQAYQMMASKFKTKDSYTSKEILGINVGIIKVRCGSQYEVAVSVYRENCFAV